jgi:hypothetical protein
MRQGVEALLIVAACVAPAASQQDAEIEMGYVLPKIPPLEMPPRVYAMANSAQAIRTTMRAQGDFAFPFCAAHLTRLLLPGVVISARDLSFCIVFAGICEIGKTQSVADHLLEA